MKESIPTFLHNYKSVSLSYIVDEKHITSNNINCIIHYLLSPKESILSVVSESEEPRGQRHR